MSKSPKRALVLSGGGARGAYEAGVLGYVLEELPEYLGERPRFDIICGTSVGAINAAWVAATLDEPEHCAGRLETLWRSLVFEEVVEFSYQELWRILRQTVLEYGLSLPARKPQQGREGGFLETTFFDELIRREIPFENIRRNLDAGLLESVSVSATDIITGQTTVFVDTAKKVPPWTRDVRRRAVGGAVTAEKVLASAAIPVVFPAVNVAGRWYCDGGLRQNTPISPALRLGADRVLVIALQNRSLDDESANLERERRWRDSHPTQAFVMGKVLDALLLDPLDYDIEVLERVNAILEYGEEAFGERRFVEELNEVIRRHRGQGYRVVEPLLIRPGRDLGEMAARFARNQRPQFWGSLPLRFLAGRALEAGGAQESDFLSYLLFDEGYTGQLYELGFRDAAARREELVEFFQD